jgi:hypothetical protein
MIASLQRIIKKTSENKLVKTQLEKLREVYIQEIKQINVRLGQCRLNDFKRYKEFVQKGQILESIDFAEASILEPKPLYIMYESPGFSLYWLALIFNEFLIVYTRLNTSDFEQLWRMAQVKFIGHYFTRYPPPNVTLAMVKLINSNCHMKKYINVLIQFITSQKSQWDIINDLNLPHLLDNNSMLGTYIKNIFKKTEKELEFEVHMKNNP